MYFSKLRLIFLVVSISLLHPFSPAFAQTPVSTSGEPVEKKGIEPISVSGSAAPFQTGDVFAALVGGQVQHYDSLGNLLETLNTGTSGFTAGLANDTSGNLYVTNFSEAYVSQFTGPGIPHDHSIFFTTDSAGFVESIIFDKAGNIYVGQAGGSKDILKYDAAGNFLARFDVATEDRGSDWIDLAADQQTMYYTSEAKNIKRYDVVNDVQLDDFSANLPGDKAYALRLLPDGGMIVADSEIILRLDQTGAVIQTYDAPGEDSWFAVNIDPNGRHFRSADFGSSNFYKFDIESGAILLGPINTGTPASTLFGLGLYGEYAEGQNNRPVCGFNPPGPFLVSEYTTLSFTVTATDPDTLGAAADSITLGAMGLPAGAAMLPALPFRGPGRGTSSAFTWRPAAGQAGSYQITYTATDNRGLRNTCRVQITVNPAPPDTLPPFCAVTGGNPGPPHTLEITLRDDESGLEQIKVLTSVNVAVDIPLFTPGTGEPVVVIATKIDQSQPSTILLKGMDAAGNFTVCDPVYQVLSSAVPEGFALKQNFPNPFNPATTIYFDVAPGSGSAVDVSIKIYDITGREVRGLLYKAMQPGQYSVEWDGANNHGEPVAGGIYLYRMVAGNFVATRKMILLK